MTWAQIPTGSRRIIEVCPAMYSPADSPLSMRAAPAKKRIWSIAGGTSSSRVSWNGLPVFSLSSRTSSSARSSMRVGDLEQGPAALGGGGVAPLLEAALGRLHGRVDVGLAGHRGLGEALAGGGVDQGRGAPVGRVPVLAPDEVLQLAKRHCLLLARAGAPAVGHACWRRAATALPTAMATPPRKISVPITFTWGGTPTRVAPYTQRGKVSTWPLTKLVTT